MRDFDGLLRLIECMSNVAEMRRLGPQLLKLQGNTDSDGNLQFPPQPESVGAMVRRLNKEKEAEASVHYYIVMAALMESN